MAAWHYMKDGNQLGPISQGDFQNLVQSGVIVGDTQIWSEGWSQWMSYSQFTAMQPAPSTPAPLPPSAPAPSQKKGGGKGLVITLSVLGVLLLAGGAVLLFLMMGDKPGLQGTWKSVDDDATMEITKVHLTSGESKLDYKVERQDGEVYELEIRSDDLEESIGIEARLKNPETLIFKLKNEEYTFKRVKTEESQNKPKPRKLTEREKNEAFLKGSWSENWPDRNCNDVAVLNSRGGRYSISMADCTDDEKYVASKVSFDGVQLSFELLTPSTGSVLKYDLVRDGSRLVGTAEGNDVKKVSWQRTTGNDDETGHENSPLEDALEEKALVGKWNEMWPERKCKDEASVSLRNGKMRISMADCTDGEVYEISNIVFKNSVLRFRLHTPSTETNLNYILHWDPHLLRGMVGDKRISWQRTQ